MASTTFSGPVTSTNGFVGAITGAVTGAVAATTLSASGAVIFSNLPVADPLVAGQLWSDVGVLTVSAG
jgi:cytoskeletal protein CcmA (bactofilin family)